MLFVILFGYAPIALGLLIAVVTLAKRSAARRRAAAEQAAREQARREKRAETERKQAARQAAAMQKKQEQEQKRQEREQRQAAAHAVKVARAAELAELAERRLQAEKELAQLRQQSAEHSTERSITTPAAPTQKQPTPQAAERPGMSLDEFAASIAPQPFKGQTVSFTGKLYNSAGEHVSREKAISLVRALGGKAYKDMPAGTTLLVVGENFGMQKMDKADQWIGQVKKITPAQFWQMAGTTA